MTYYCYIYYPLCVATVLSTFEVGAIINPRSKVSKQKQMVGHSQDQWEA